MPSKAARVVPSSLLAVASLVAWLGCGGAPEAARDFREPFGREGRGLLVPNVDQRQIRLHRTVVEHEQMAAGEGEHRVDTVALQHLDCEASTVCLHGATARSRATTKRSGFEKFFKQAS